MVDKTSVITFIAMGTVNTITLFNQVSDEVKVAVFQLVNELENKFTVNRAQSEVMSINDAAGKKPVAVSDDVFELIQRAVAAGLLPDSGFNPAIGNLTKLWKKCLTDRILPSPAQISSAMKAISPRNIKLNAEQKTVFLTQADMSIDLGAIAKGYIADQIATLLAEYHIYSGIIDLGGNIVVIGNSPKNPQGIWKVGIQKPFAKRGLYAGIVSVRNKSVVTSGNYEKYTEINGKQYHHIIDPRTGYPFEGPLDSVTIISDNSIEGEILSTLLYFHGLKQGLKLIQNAPHFFTSSYLGAVFISKDKKIYLSQNLINKFKLVCSDYELGENHRFC
ncbi:FAD:protein FMN transferase [Pasteurellaceae bacterium LIM206]|nr:FAD:protein FMN transferase [Pasteurellaceae bacterium LIM206]